MTTNTSTITLINPWTQAEVTIDEAEATRLLDVCRNILDDEIREDVHMLGLDSNVSWIAAYAALAGIEETSRILLGS